MGLEDRAFHELITESQDLHVDAMKQIRDTVPELVVIREERRGQGVNTDEIERLTSVAARC